MRLLFLEPVPYRERGVPLPYTELFLVVLLRALELRETVIEPLLVDFGKRSTSRLPPRSSVTESAATE